MNLAFYANPIDRLHQENHQFLKSQRFCDRNNMPFSRQVELEAAKKLNGFGYQVIETVHNHPYDLEVIDRTRRFIRVEVKGAQAYRHPRRSVRYQSNIRNEQHDLLIFVCFDEAQYHYFVIPAGALGRRRNVTIWNPDPARYAGQWSKYYNAWQYLEQAFEKAMPYPKQLIFNL